jgi:hypothetical protein
MGYSNLKYYRGEYNPENIFAQGGSPEDGIISMYNPQSMANLTNAAVQHQNRFDQGESAALAEKARIGETETYDLKDLTDRLKGFEGSINDIVQNKYNGDYGAAANEIANQIGTERTNPFYHFNSQKVQMGKMYLDAKEKLGANFMSSANPFSVSFQDWQNGKSLDFTPVNRDDIVRNASVAFAPIAKTLIHAPTETLDPSEQMIQLRIQKGMASPQEVSDFITNHPQGQKMVQQVIGSMPELAGLPQDEVMKAITQGAYSAIGDVEVQHVANQDYMYSLKAQLKRGAMGGGSPDRIVEAGNIQNFIPEDEVRKDPSWANMRDEYTKAWAQQNNKTGINHFEDLAGSEKDAVISAMRPAHSLMILNNFFGNTAEERKEQEDTQKEFDDVLNKYQTGTMVGATSHDSHLMKNLSNYKMLGFSIVPTPNSTKPLRIYIRATGIPTDKTGAQRQPQEVGLMLNPEARDANRIILNEISKLDPNYINTILTQVGEFNKGRTGAQSGFYNLMGKDYVPYTR